MSKIQVNTNKVRFPVAPDLYGLFFEDINRSADGGLYPEMLRNRSFEDSILPLGCHVDKNNPDLLVTPTDYRSAFCGGEGRRNWNGDTAVFNDGYLDMCWLWNGCPLDLGGAVINEISATVKIEMPEKDSTVYLVSMDEQGIALQPVETNGDGQYTVALEGLNIDASKGFIPTVYIKDATKHNTGNDSGYFEKAEVTTVSFKINGIELTTPQNPVGSTAQMGGCLDVCWIWNGCDLKLADNGIQTITDISVTFELKMPAAEQEPAATEPAVTTTEETTTTTEATTTEATTTEATTAEATTAEAESPEIGVITGNSEEETPAEEEAPVEEEEEAPADNEAEEQKEFPLVPVLIGVGVVAVIALAVVIAIPSKKK